MITIGGLTKRVSFEEAEKLVEEGRTITGIVALRPYDLLDMTREEFWDRLEEDAVDAYILEKDNMDEELLVYDKEHDVLLFKVDINARSIEK